MNIMHRISMIFVRTFFVASFFSFCSQTVFSAPGQSKATSEPQKKVLTRFTELVPGVDMFSSSRELLTPFIKPLSDGLVRLKDLLGEDLPKGAFILCNSVAEKDSVSDEKYLRQGYLWVLTELTPEATRQQRLEMIKARFAQQNMPVPEQIMSRINSSDPKENERNLARQTTRIVTRASLAVVSVLLQPEKPFRTSRVEDLARSPLADWLDIGISNYIANNTLASVGWIKQRIEEVYSLEDLFQMNEPFVAGSGTNGSGGVGGGGMVIIGGGSRGSGSSAGGVSTGGNGRGASGGTSDASQGARVFMGTPGGGGEPGGSGSGRGRMQMPQEMIDKMNFDNQATLVFAYIAEVLGKEKMKGIIKLSRDGKEVVAALEKPEYFGKPLSEIEKGWIEWVKAQKAPEGGPVRMM